MSKKFLIILAVLAILAGGGLTGYFLFYSKGKTKGPNTISSILKDKDGVGADLTYTDGAGFSFAYPKGITVKDITPVDSVTYTKLSLQKGKESLEIDVKDTTAKIIDPPSAATLSGATTLGGISAKQYASGDILYTMAIDAGILYVIQGPKDGDFWEETQNLIVSTFSFAGSAETTTEGDGAVYEEEEIVE
ncbi:MAG: hypothetical protein AAB875_04635 [Patescibacteria group bacterium]